MTAAFRRYPLAAFFILAIIFSWGSYIALSGPLLFPIGSLVAAVIVANITTGRAGLKDLLLRCLRWRFSPLWYAAALLVPAAIGATAFYINIWLGASVTGVRETGPWYAMLILLPAAMLDAPLWEDSGWRGFAMPHFSGDRSRLTITIILGLYLALWHLPLALAGGAAAPPYLIATFCSAIVTNRVYYGARESALAAILYHSSANATVFIFPIVEGRDLVNYFWLLAALNCLVAVFLILIKPRFWLKARDRADS